MNPSINPQNTSIPADEDLAEQARPGHGVPSQDPDPAAQVGLTEHETERESKSVLMGGGVMAGAATGAAIGVALAGPVGVVVGGTLGGVAGALGGAAAGTQVDTHLEERPATVAERPVGDAPDRVSTDPAQ